MLININILTITNFFKYNIKNYSLVYKIKYVRNFLTLKVGFLFIFLKKVSIIIIKSLIIRQIKLIIFDAGYHQTTAI